MFRTLLLAAVFVAVNASAAPSDVPRGKLPRQVVPTAYEVDLRMDYAVRDAQDLVYGQTLHDALGDRLHTHAGSRGQRSTNGAASMRW
jgi:hypothetical protein